MANITDLNRYQFYARKFQRDVPVVSHVIADPPATRRGDEANPAKLIKASLERWANDKAEVNAKIMKFLPS